MSKISSNLTTAAKFRIQVSVLGTEERQSKIQNYTVYIIEVIINSIVSKVFLRFKEFNELQDQIHKFFPLVSLPYFQDKVLIGNHSEKVIENRKLSIQSFLQTLLGSPDFYDHHDQSQITKVQQILKFIGLPKNFYQLPQLLNQYNEGNNEEHKIQV